MHLATGTVDAFLPFEPFNADYFGLTKLGSVLGVAGLVRWAGLGGDAAMRVLMLGGFALLLIASASLVRAWSGASWPIVAATLLLMPGVAESAFFFNDNVPAAGLLVAGLALLRDGRSAVRSCLAGSVIGLAVVARTDMVLATAAVPLILLERGGLATRAMRDAVLAGASALVVVTICYAAVHVTPLDALRVGSIAVDLWAKPPSVLKHGLELLLFCGLPGLVLVPFGLVALVRARSWARLALLAGIPLVLNGVLFGKMWEVRQFLPLTPFLGALIATGSAALVRGARARRVVGPAIAASLVAAVWLGAPSCRVTSDGPRNVLGRLRGIADWRDWQEAVRGEFRTIDGVVSDVIRGPSTIVLADGWNEDRYLHLRLLEAGFAMDPRADAATACGAIGERVQRGSSRVTQLSLRQSFLPEWRQLQPERMERFVLPCVAASPTAPVVLLARRSRVARLLDGDPAHEALEGATLTLSEDPIVAVTLAPAMTGRLLDGYRAIAEASGGERAHTVPEALAATRARTGFNR